MNNKFQKNNLIYTQLVNTYIKLFHKTYDDKHIDLFIQGMYECPKVWGDIYDIKYRIDFEKYRSKLIEPTPELTILINKINRSRFASCDDKII